MAFLGNRSASFDKLISEVKELLKQLFGPRYDTKVKDLLDEFDDASFSADLNSMIVRVDERESVIHEGINGAQNKLMWEFFKRWTGVGDDAEVFSWRLEILANDAVVFENVQLFARDNLPTQEKGDD